MYSEPFTWLFRTLDTYPFTVLSDLIFVDQEGNVKNWIETEEFKICADFFGHPLRWRLHLPRHPLHLLVLLESAVLR